MVLQILLLLLGALAILLVIGWLGLQVPSPRFESPAAGADPRRVPIPAGLPSPVERYARIVFGESIPVFDTAMITGHARLSPFGLPMPTRFRFYYDVRRSSHYHEIHVTWFTRPFLRIHERNLEGHVTLELSLLGRVDNQPKTNRAGIQGYWAEALAWLPSIVLTDSRVRWVPVDETSARLMLPGLDAVEAFTVRFDPTTGLMTDVETMRYQAEEHTERWRWRNYVREWGTVDGMRIPLVSPSRWNDSKPWATWVIEHIALNADVATRFATFGGKVSAAPSPQPSV